MAASAAVSADGFLDTLMRVLAEPEPFDHMVIEASGVGDPGAIAEIALVEPSLVLHGVIVLADAERLPTLAVDRRLDETVARQIRSADLLVLNKCDLVDPAGLAAARAVLASQRPGVPVVETVEAALPDGILALDQLRPKRPRHSLPSAQASHEMTFARVLYRRAGAFDREGLGRALDAMPASLLRLKGSLCLGDQPSTHLLQLVGRRWTLTRCWTVAGRDRARRRRHGDRRGRRDPPRYRLASGEPPILQGDLHRCA